MKKIASPAPVEKVIEPFEASADGRRNAFIFHCAVTEQRRGYAVCLSLCEKRKQGRLTTVYADCSAAIGKKRCPALTMRKEEKEAGHAIYFEERVRSLGEAFVSKARDIFAPSRAAKERPIQSAPAAKSSVIDRIDTTSYQDVLNMALAAPAPVIQKTEVKPGESLLEMARRLMGK